jgi:hypothetical protein
MSPLRHKADLALAGTNVRFLPVSECSAVVPSKPSNKRRSRKHPETTQPSDATEPVRKHDVSVDDEIATVSCGNWYPGPKHRNRRLRRPLLQF